ncbi:hypothetical protein [Neobacillus terrae]|uniref:hypothetical protein n=1 Tax=Neobacillus terrae TaxID=3034837 RepID=UPI00140E901E|nr:hypothetical protein [Neobacillus terrae]NHM32698.1 hypothetical protein [Neobacillus terrae]
MATNTKMMGMGSLAIGAATYIMQNKDLRDKLMGQVQSMMPGSKSSSSSSSVNETSTMDGTSTMKRTTATDQKSMGSILGASKGKLLGSLAMGAAAYLMTNKQARQKVIGQMGMSKFSSSESADTSSTGHPGSEVYKDSLPSTSVPSGAYDEEMSKSSSFGKASYNGDMV